MQFGMRGIGSKIGYNMTKHLLFIFIAWLCVASAYAQKPDSSLISRYRPGLFWFYSGLRTKGRADVHKYERLILDVFYCDWNTPKVKPFQSDWTSIGWNIQSLFDIPVTKWNNVSLGVGLGYEHTRLQSNFVLDRMESTKSTELSDFLPVLQYEKSVFKTNKLFVPIELRFRTSGWKHFKFVVGGRIGYQFSNSTLFQYTNAETTVRQTTVGFYDFRPLSLSTHLRIGIRNWAITGSYNLNPYFKSAQSTKINGFQIGCSIALF